MADNLIQKSHKNSDKNKYNNVVHRTTSESLRLNESEKGVTHPTSLQAAHNPRKISSFQITSVTVGSRVSTDAGEDSADDLDESHTDDISRVTDIENETPSFSEDTFSKDEVFYNASSASLGCAPVIPTSSQYGLAIVGQDSAPNQLGGAVPNVNSSQVSDMHVSVTNAGTGSIINIIGNAKPQEGMKEIQEHVRNERFKVVKIESTEPFRRGRWMCMDYLDHTTTQPNAPIIVNNNIDIAENNTLQAPDSGVVINDSQHEDVPNSNDLTAKGPKEIQPCLQIEQNVQKQFPVASPGQSLTQPIVVQQQIPNNQSVSVQSPPIEMPQQIPNQNMQPTQQVGQQHPQSMTHITLQNTGQNHPAPQQQQQQQQQQVQQIPQSFPQHQLQQVIAQSQGMAMQQIPMHQQMPQQMQPLPNQVQMQMNPHLSQTQMPNMQQMQQQMPQMQGLQAQGQLTQVPNQQSQMQQMQMQGQPNPQQIHQMQQAQIPNMAQGHHLQNQQPMGAQQSQLQHIPGQAQMQALQNQQIPNHMSQMQMPTQLASANQQIQMQTQMHQMPTQPQQSMVPGMHAQMQQPGMASVQQQYNQAINQQPNQTIVQPQHNVPQYHSQPSQMSQQGQTLPQEVLTSIASSQQGNTMAIVTQPQGSTLPANLQTMTGQPQGSGVHSMAPQQQQVPQSNMQMMTAPPQNMQMTLDGNQTSMQIPASEQMYMQQANVGQHMLSQQQVQYVPSGQVPLAHQSMPLPMPVGMHPAVVPTMNYGGGVVDAAVSGTNSPVVSLPANTAGYAQPPHDAQGFGSPVSGVVAHVSSVPPSESGAPEPAAESLPSDAADGKDDQPAPNAEDESINGLALALGGSGVGSPTSGSGPSTSEPRDTATSSRAPSPPPADRQALSSASGTSAVAIDNKIEQAMDLVKSHLMFAVREEVEVLKERIAELMERINQLEVENTYLRAHASQDTLAQLPASKPAPPQGPPPPVS